MKPYYEADGITIYHARCEDVLPSIDPADVDLVLTDPPYGIGLDTDFGNVRMGGRKGRTYARVEGDSEPFTPDHLMRFPRLLLWGANHYAHKLPAGGRWVVWRKRGAGPCFAAAELAWHNCGGRPVDYFESTVPGMKAREGFLHPTQKPVELMRWALERFTKVGELVLDPYMGSGPVAQACYEMKRRYIGIECVEDYCRVAVKRLSQGVLDFGEAA